jgi:Fur family transcriptional regulator, ferric uptake regulator
VNQAAIRKRLEQHLASQGLKLTPQRERIFERAFATHEHFSAETLYQWMREEQGPRVSRATVYRTLNLLQEGGFIDSFEATEGQVVYEHVLGHRHHDHLICVECGRIDEFHDERIERLQEEIAEARGFDLVKHSHRLLGHCPACRRKLATEASGASRSGTAGRAEATPPEGD